MEHLATSVHGPLIVVPELMEVTLSAKRYLIQKRNAVNKPYTNDGRS